MAALERAVAELVEKPAARGPREGDFWVLEGLKEAQPEGGIVYAGHLDLPGAGPVQWQYGLTSDRFSDEEWESLAPTLDALGHPVRLRLLQLVFGGVRTTAELTTHESLRSAGQVHHHLRILVSAGWLAQRSRGTYEIPGPRVVPLLVTLLAARPA